MSSVEYCIRKGMGASTYSTTKINCHQIIKQLKKMHFEKRLPDKRKVLEKYGLFSSDKIGCLPMDIQGTNLFLVWGCRQNLGHCACPQFCLHPLIWLFQLIVNTLFKQF